MLIIINKYIIYIKTIFFFSLTFNKQMLEFTYDNSLYLYNLEVLIYIIYLFIIISISLLILIVSITIPGIFLFEFKKILNKFIIFIIGLTFYIDYLNSIFENFFLYSNFNSSSTFILFNPRIDKFI